MFQDQPKGQRLRRMIRERGVSRGVELKWWGRHGLAYRFWAGSPSSDNKQSAQKISHELSVLLPGVRTREGMRRAQSKKCGDIIDGYEIEMLGKPGKATPTPSWPGAGPWQIHKTLTQC